ncbi:unnamed protein product [Closterium sp. NIES-64]|nr:unnamed protein product [Closterium sp. NIES-64]CAI5994730.1 unnamed protein product [Closterium sp. NIES-64]
MPAVVLTWPPVLSSPKTSQLSPAKPSLPLSYLQPPPSPTTPAGQLRPHARPRHLIHPPPHSHNIRIPSPPPPQVCNIFHTDLNGFQMVRRKTFARIPLQFHFYPMPALAFLQHPSGLRFSVHTRQVMGAASLKMVLDQRLNQDDGRVLAQGVSVNYPVVD